MDFKKCYPVILAALLLGLAGCSKSPEEVKAAKAKLEAETTGRLVVKSNRASTTVVATRLPAAGEAASDSFKGVEEGAAEQTLSALPPGKYTVIAHSDGWPDIRAEANVAAGGTSAVAVNFKSGSLRLDSDPSGATVKLGNAVLGKTPLVIPQLPPGACPLSLEYPSWPAVAFKATITENVESTETVRLPHGKLTVESIPPGATVLLGGKAYNKTPLFFDPLPAGLTKLTLQTKDFPPLEVAVTVDDQGDVKVSRELGSGFPELDPLALLRAVWVVDNPDQIAPRVDTVTGPYQPQNGIVKNLNRKRLFDFWLRKNYRFSAIVKAYDPVSGQVEFAEQNSALSKYRVLAKLSPEARNSKDLAAQLTKGATFTLYGHFTAVEEPRWPSRVITFEISPGEPLH
jgi:hypothetical protein